MEKLTTPFLLLLDLIRKYQPGAFADHHVTALIKNKQTCWFAGGRHVGIG